MIKNLLDNICCHKYTEVNICVVNGVLLENRLLSKGERYVLSKKAIVMHSKIVHLCCCFSLLVVCRSRI